MHMDNRWLIHFMRKRAPSAWTLVTCYLFLQSTLMCSFCPSSFHQKPLLEKFSQGGGSIHMSEQTQEASLIQHIQGLAERHTPTDKGAWQWHPSSGAMWEMWATNSLPSWQQVEDVHFGSIMKMIGPQEYSSCSIHQKKLKETSTESIRWGAEEVTTCFPPSMFHVVLWTKDAPTWKWPITDTQTCQGNKERPWMKNEMIHKWCALRRIKKHLDRSL